MNKEMGSSEVSYLVNLVLQFISKGKSLTYSFKYVQKGITLGIRHTFDKYAIIWKCDGFGTLAVIYLLMCDVICSE